MRDENQSLYYVLYKFRKKFGFQKYDLAEIRICSLFVSIYQHLKVEFARTKGKPLLVLVATTGHLAN